MIKDWGGVDKTRLPFGHAVKFLVTRSLNRLCIYKLVRKPIFIFSMRRSGSTLLMEMIYSQPGFDYCGQPLDLWDFHPYYHRLPHPSMSQFISLSAEDEKKLYTFFNDLLTGRIRFRNQWRVWQPNFHFHVDRLVIKVLNANPLIEWFAKNFDIDIIYLVRHPIPTSLSIIKRGWESNAKAYLEDSDFCRTHVPPDARDLGFHLLEKGTKLQLYVLEWCLANLYPLRTFKERAWLTVTYEELLLRSREISELICTHCHLPDPEGMQKVIYKPSRTTAHDRRRLIRKDPKALTCQWLKELSPSEVAGVKEVLEAFGIWAYDASNPWPHSKLCHFGSLGGLEMRESPPIPDHLR